MNLTNRLEGLLDFLQSLSRNRLALAGLIIIVAFSICALLAPFLAPHNPLETAPARMLRKPSSQHLLGTDGTGRDILSRLLYGARLSLSIGVVAVAIGLFFGVPLGAMSGYLGGRVDLLVQRIVDVMLAFPALLLAILAVSILGIGLQNAMIAIGITYIAPYVRLVRGSVLSVKEEEFVLAARAIGQDDLQIIFRHILLNVLGPVAVQSALNIGSAILHAAGLGFLGLGAMPPTPEWGAMLSQGRAYISVAPHVTIFPGVAIALSVLGFNLLGDGLRDALDPESMP